MIRRADAPRSGRSRPRAAGILLAVAALAAPAAAQQQPSAPPADGSPFGEIIDVRVINVEVVVTDRDGVRVGGLGADDFRLLVDGEERPVDYFTEVRGGVALAPAEAAGAAAGPPALSPGSAVPTSYLLFIDDYFSIARDRDRVLEELTGQLPGLGPEDRMAVVAYDGGELDMLTTWSRSLRQLEDAFKAARDRPAFGLQRFAELRTFDRDRQIRPQLTGFAANRLDPVELEYARRLSNQVERSVDAAAATLRAFAAPPGRKVMLLLVGGWPYSPADYAVRDPARLVQDPLLPAGDELYRGLSDTANLLGYTLYPVDVPGLGSDALGVEDTLADATPAGVLRRENELHASLDYLADQTGGRALLNAERDEALAGAVADTRSYYWLGFTARRAGDDARRKIEVEVRRKGFAARSRGSFRDLSRQREVSLAVESVLRFGSPPGTTTLPVEIGEPQKAGFRRMEVPLTVAVPAEMITLLPVEGGLAGRVELRIAVLDESGETAEIPIVPIDVRLDREPKPGGFVIYRTSVRLRRIEHRLLVAVYDPVSGGLATAEASVTPP